MDKLDIIMRALPDAAVATDGQGRVIRINQGVVRLFGFANRREALRELSDGSWWRQVEMLDGSAPGAAGPDAEMMGECQFCPPGRLLVLPKRGRERVVEVTMQPIGGAGEAQGGTISILRDVTLRTEHELHCSSVSFVAQAVAGEVRLDRILAIILDQAERLVDAAVCAVLWKADPGDGGLALLTARGRSGVITDLGALGAHVVPLAEQALGAGRIRVLGSRERKHAARHGSGGEEGTVVVAPLRSGGKKLGVLYMETRSPRRIRRAELTAIDTLTDLFARSVERACLYEAVERAWLESEARATRDARLLSELRSRAHALEEERERREEFISVVAHELRGPMTVLSGYSQLYQRDWAKMTGWQAQGAQAIIEQTRKLNRLVLDLLDVSRIAAGRFAVQRGNVDLLSIVEKVVAEQRLTSAGHDLVLERPDHSVIGWWDADRIDQALTNLVSNAIKYSPRGGRVQITVIPRRRRVEVRIADEGIGIAPEDIPGLFQPYTRARQPSQVGGIGLGLYIVKGIAEAHGGHVAVQSRPGQGSTFFLTLPVRSSIAAPEYAGLRAG